MRFKPWTLALNAHMQLFWHLIIQTVSQAFIKMPYRREIFQLEDGGELALDWVEHPTRSKRDLVVCIPGLSGDSNELYCRTVA